MLAHTAQLQAHCVYDHATPQLFNSVAAQASAGQVDEWGVDAAVTLQRLNEGRRFAVGVLTPWADDLELGTPPITRGLARLLTGRGSSSNLGAFARADVAAAADISTVLLLDHLLLNADRQTRINWFVRRRDGVLDQPRIVAFDNGLAGWHTGLCASASSGSGLQLSLLEHPPLFTLREFVRAVGGNNVSAKGLGIFDSAVVRRLGEWRTWLPHVLVYLRRDPLFRFAHARVGVRADADECVAANATLDGYVYSRVPWVSVRDVADPHIVSTALQRPVSECLHLASLRDAGVCGTTHLAVESSIAMLNASITAQAHEAMRHIEGRVAALGAQTALVDVAALGGTEGLSGSADTTSDGANRTPRLASDLAMCNALLRNVMVQAPQALPVNSHGGGGDGDIVEVAVPVVVHSHDGDEASPSGYDLALVAGAPDGHGAPVVAVRAHMYHGVGSALLSLPLATRTALGDITIAIGLAGSSNLCAARTVSLRPSHPDFAFLDVMKDDSLVVTRGNTLHISAGSVITLRDGASIVVRAGATVLSEGTTGAPVLISFDATSSSGAAGLEALRLEGAANLSETWFAALPRRDCGRRRCPGARPFPHDFAAIRVQGAAASLAATGGGVIDVVGGAAVNVRGGRIDLTRILVARCSSGVVLDSTPAARITESHILETPRSDQGGDDASGPAASTALVVRHNSSVTITDSVFAWGAAAGIRVEWSHVTVKRSIVESFGRQGIVVSDAAVQTPSVPPSHVVITDSTVASNRVSGVEVGAGRAAVHLGNATVTRNHVGLRVGASVDFVGCSDAGCLGTIEVTASYVADNAHSDVLNNVPHGAGRALAAPRGRSVRVGPGCTIGDDEPSTVDAHDADRYRPARARSDVGHVEPRDAVLGWLASEKRRRHAMAARGWPRTTHASTVRARLGEVSIVVGDDEGDRFLALQPGGPVNARVASSGCAPQSAVRHSRWEAAEALTTALVDDLLLTHIVLPVMVAGSGDGMTRCILWALPVRHGNHSPVLQVSTDVGEAAAGRADPLVFEALHHEHANIVEYAVMWVVGSCRGAAHWQTPDGTLVLGYDAATLCFSGLDAGGTSESFFSSLVQWACDVDEFRVPRDVMVQLINWAMLPSEEAFVDDVRAAGAAGTYDARRLGRVSVTPHRLSATVVAGDDDDDDTITRLGGAYQRVRRLVEACVTPDVGYLLQEQPAALTRTLLN